MQILKVLTAAILAASVVAVPAGAQSLTNVDGPKELPPAGFTGNQYVDSAGCVFIRAGVGGQTTWVPRVSRDRKLVCGYEPTFPPGMLEAAAAVKAGEAAAAKPAPAAESAPAAEPAPSATKMSKPAPAPAQAPAAAPAPVEPLPPRSLRSKPVPAEPRDVRLVRAGAIARSDTLCLGRIPAAQRYLLSDGRRVTQCAGSAPDEPVAYLNGLGVPDLTVTPGLPSAKEIEQALKADRGAYRVVWQRGDVAGQVAAGVHVSPAVPGRYVQVGVFAEPANAQAAITRLKSMNLPVASSLGSKNGRAVKAIMAGPFASGAEAQAALAGIRKAGYRDAYIRG